MTCLGCCRRVVLGSRLVWLIGSIADKLESVVDVVSLLSRLDHCHIICLGNADGKFNALMSEGRFMKSSDMYKVAQSTNTVS